MKLEVCFIGSDDRLGATVGSNSILLHECVHSLYRHACQLQNVGGCSVAFS